MNTMKWFEFVEEEMCSLMRYEDVVFVEEYDQNTSINFVAERKKRKIEMEYK